MTKGRGPGLEPYDGVQMRNYLVKECGATKIRQTGNHGFYRLPNGNEAGLPENGDYITRVLATSIAGAMGLTLQDLRAALGYQRIGAGRPGRTVKKLERKSECSKGEALDALDDAISLLNDLRDETVPGVRDGAHYLKIQTLARRVARIAKGMTA